MIDEWDALLHDVEERQVSGEEALRDAITEVRQLEAERDESDKKVKALDNTCVRLGIERDESQGRLDKVLAIHCPEACTHLCECSDLHCAECWNLHPCDTAKAAGATDE